MAIDFLVLGGGVAGLAVGATLGADALVLEATDRPGGLVRSFALGDYWFDQVLHLLYVPDEPTHDWLLTLPDLHLAPCPPEAWVDTPAGTVRYPYQMHLAGLPPEHIRQCLLDLAQVTFAPSPEVPTNFAEHLLATFGRGLCEGFLFPYNRKMWRRPLETLAPSGFQWTITPPALDQVLAGALERDPGFRAYNAHGEYPRPPAEAPVRGMECLARAIASQVADLRCGWRVEAIDPAAREVQVRVGGHLETLIWQEACIATLPLPQLIARCTGVPPALQAAVAQLKSNRVWTAAYAVEGPRRSQRGHWRYNSDESIAYTRTITMTAFDPAMAPPEGFGLMAEVTQRGEEPPPDPVVALRDIEADLRRQGDLTADDRIVAQTLVLAEPAYVVFETGTQAIVREATAWLASQGIQTVGRYGRWEYSSMGQVMRDGLHLARGLREGSRLPVEAG